MRNILRIIRNVLIVIVLTVMFITIFAFAFLQESYRLNPPTKAEIEEHPIIIKFVYGGLK